jgi:hypothetical protein
MRRAGAASRALERAGLPPILLVPCRSTAPPPLPQPFRPPLRVALFGHGTVGGGVYEALRAWPDRFLVVGVAVRHPERHPTVPRDLLETDVLRLVEREADIVVELLGGLDPATEVIERALERGRRVVTANKAVVARRPDLHARVRCSASVGGVIPVLETVRRLGSSFLPASRAWSTARATRAQADRGGCLVRGRSRGTGGGLRGSRSSPPHGWIHTQRRVGAGGVQDLDPTEVERESSAAQPGTSWRVAEGSRRGSRSRPVLHSRGRRQSVPDAPEM